jgi:HEAT repeat protein
MKATAITLTVISFLLAGCGRDQQEKSLSPVEKAEKRVGSPCQTGNADPDLVPQTWKRLRNLEYEGYRFQESDRPAWRTLLTNDRSSVYARMCAAFFLMDTDQNARRFVQQHLKSTNLRHRYNAAQVLEMYTFHPPARPFDELFERDSTKSWAIELLIEQVANGSLDGSGVTSSDGYEMLPDGDWDDIMCTPIGDICRGLGSVKEANAVPALIKMVERQPELGRASWAIQALGEIGDARAIPVLMAHWQAGLGEEHSLIGALGKLKCREAVPLLIARLETAPNSRQQMDATPTEVILEALLAIGAKEAIPAIENAAAWTAHADPIEPPQTDFSPEDKAAARRVLIQLRDQDPVPGLFALLEEAPNDAWEGQTGPIMRALAKQTDDRVVERFGEIARTSKSAACRQAAIFCLKRMGYRRALVELASLLDERFPPELTDWFKVPESDRPTYFPGLLVDCLKRATNQDFGTDSEQWKQWIEAHVKD